MKWLHEVFTDEEFKLLKKSKGSKTWHSFILELATEKLTKEKGE